MTRQPRRTGTALAGLELGFHLRIQHGSRLRTLSDTYKRYLENFFRKRFKLVGTPVRFVFKEGENPYKDKKNVLSDRRVAKKRRLIRHVKRKG